MQSRYSLGLGPGFGQTKRYITSSASQGPRHLRAVCDTTLALHHFRQLHTSNSGRLAAEYFKELLQFLTVSSNSMPGSKPRLESLQAALQKFNKQGGKEKNIMLSDSARADLCWWEKMLAGGMDIPVYTPNAHSVFVDASTGWGLAVVNGENAWVWKWRDLWRESDKYNANWAELVAIELGIRAASMVGLRDIVVHSDSTSALSKITRINDMHSMDIKEGAVLARILKHVQAQQVRFSVRWVPSEENIADSLSRGKPMAMVGPATYPPLPSELKPFLDCDGGRAALASK